MSTAPTPEELYGRIRRLDQERGQACYDRDAARSVVAHWEHECKRLEIENERLRKEEKRLSEWCLGWRKKCSELERQLEKR
jgi:predicted nuclease with TOPRIM domain